MSDSPNAHARWTEDLTCHSSIIPKLFPVRCENSAEDGSPKMGVSTTSRRLVPRNLGPICGPTIPQARPLEPGQPLGHASAVDPLPLPLAFLLLLVSGWVNRH